MQNLVYKSPTQKDPYTSSWSLKEVLGIRLWQIVWLLFFRTSPKLFGRYWRVFLLKLFGAKLTWDVFLYSSSKVYVPWLLKMKSRSCLGPNTEIYNLGPVEIEERVTISQYSYICNGTHDFSNSRSPLLVGYIKIHNDVFVGARSFIMPGVEIGEFAVIGACSVVTKNVEPWAVVVGNPAKFIKKRVINE